MEINLESLKEDEKKIIEYINSKLTLSYINALFTAICNAPSIGL